MENPASQRMNKREVCAYLGKSKRSVENYIRDGRLKVGYVKGKNGNTAVFERGDVERFKGDLEAWRAEEPFHKARIAPNGATESPRPSIAPRTDAAAALAAHLAALSFEATAGLGRFLTPEQAAEYSGLPKSYLIRQARAGVPWAVNVSLGKREVWRFRVVADTLHKLGNAS